MIRRDSSTNALLPINYLNIGDATATQPLAREQVRIKRSAMNTAVPQTSDACDPKTARILSSFLANMSHEIRTPLTSIVGFAELLPNPKGSAADKTCAASTIVRNGRHLRDVINDVLDLLKIETRELESEFIEVGLPRGRCEQRHGSHALLAR